jgi:hypothetical protein
MYNNLKFNDSVGCHHKFHHITFFEVLEKGLEYRCLLEAAIGIEPMNKGFADLCLTTWLRRQSDVY